MMSQQEHQEFQSRFKDEGVNIKKQKGKESEFQNEGSIKLAESSHSEEGVKLCCQRP
ncbi:unnamed protein product [Paramecium octaurelia]|uniref:Uncharacterized protein n=1 Tax=Paramecium octaurelia TaxID=43137 RepID=A0A8S1XNI6_PAROT|nr:unnamed protein product [Paramecium octaurelia]